MERLVEAVKIAALDVMHNSKPVEVCFGTVTNAEPLEITIDDIPYDKDFRILTRNVTDYQTKITIPETLGVSSSGSCSHGSASINTLELPEKMNCTIHNNLKVWERVILLRLQGGQKYLVLDRVVNE